MSEQVKQGQVFTSDHQGNIYLRRDLDDPDSYFFEIEHVITHKGQTHSRKLISAYFTSETLIDLFGYVGKKLSPGERKPITLQLTLLEE